MFDLGSKLLMITCLVSSSLGAVTLGDALDAPGLTWLSGGDAPWSGDIFNTCDGVDAGRSGTLVAGEVSYVQTTVTGPGDLSFDWHTSCDPTWDALNFSINGAPPSASISGEDFGVCETRNFSLTAGSQTLRWTFVRGAVTPSGQEKGFLDKVMWSPYTPTPSRTITKTRTISPTFSPTPTMTPTSTPVILTPPFFETFESGVLPPGWTTNSTNDGSVRVTSEQAGYLGSTYLVIMDDTVDDATSSLNELILHVNLEGQYQPYLTYRATSYNDNPESLPASYSGSVNGDGVSLSEDGVNWIKWSDLAPNQAPAWKVVGLTFIYLTTDSFTDKSHVRIKFQQYGNRPVTFQGLGFDSIGVNAVGTPTSTITESHTASPTATISPTHTNSPTASPTSTTTPSYTNSPSATPSDTATPTSTATWTPTATATSSHSPTLTATLTDSPTSTATFTRTITTTFTASPTATPTHSATLTLSPTGSFTSTSTNSPTWTATATVTTTATATFTATSTPSWTRTATVTQSQSPSPTPTFTLSFSASPTQAYQASMLEKSVLAPVPARTGGQVCLYFKKMPESSHWRVFNSAGEMVSRLNFERRLLDHCWDIVSAPGVYIATGEIHYADGSSEKWRQKILIIP